MRICGSCVCAAASSRWQYSISSQSLCSVLTGSFSCTGMATLERSFPMLAERMLHTFTPPLTHTLGSLMRRCTMLLSRHTHRAIHTQMNKKLWKKMHKILNRSQQGVNNSSKWVCVIIYLRYPSQFPPHRCRAPLKHYHSHHLSRSRYLKPNCAHKHSQHEDKARNIL